MEHTKEEIIEKAKEYCNDYKGYCKICPRENLTCIAGDGCRFFADDMADEEMLGIVETYLEEEGYFKKSFDWKRLKLSLFAGLVTILLIVGFFWLLFKALEHAFVATTVVIVILIWLIFSLGWWDAFGDSEGEKDD